MYFKTKHIGILLIIIPIVVSSCQKKETPINNLFGNKIIILGHGGMGIGQTYPINTYESILKCIASGADGCEMDVQLTKDNVLIAYHDYDLSGNTNLKGLVNSLTWNDIQKGHYVEKPYLNYSILNIDNLFSKIKNLHDYKFTFDCKLYSDGHVSFFDDYVEAISKLIEKYNLYENVYIESQNMEFLLKLQQQNSKFKLFIYHSPFEETLKLAINNHLYGISMSTEWISAAQIKRAHKHNIYVAIWNVHSPQSNANAIKKSPDFIQTDRVRYLLSIIK